MALNTVGASAGNSFMESCQSGLLAHIGNVMDLQRSQRFKSFTLRQMINKGKQ